MMAPEDLTDDALAVLVREACERQVAQQAGVRPPTWTSFGGEGHGSFAPGGLPRSSRRRSVSIAVAAAAILIFVVVALGLDRRDDPSPVVTGPTTSVPDEPSPVGLLPSEAPLGLPVHQLTLADDVRDVDVDRWQLLSGPGGAMVQIRIDPSFVTHGTEATVVRGLDGGWSGELTVTWTEDGRPVEASAVGMDREELVAFLDGLETRSADLADGYRPAAGDGAILGEIEGPLLRRAQLVVSYEDRYAAVEDPRTVAVVSSVGPPGQPSWEHLAIRFAGVEAADGSFRSYDARSGTLRIARPDGSVAQVESSSAGLTEQDLDSIAASLRPVDAAEVEAQQAAAWARVQRLPLVASVTSPSGVTVELRGSTRSQTACLVVRAQRRCGTPEGYVQAVSAEIDGDWLVAAVTPEPSSLHAFAGDREGGPGPDLRTASGSIDVAGEQRAWLLATVEGGRSEVFLRLGDAWTPIERPSG